MSIALRLLAGFLIAVFVAQPAALFWGTAPVAQARPATLEKRQPTIMYAIVKTSVTVRFLDSKDELTGPTPSGGWSGTPSRMLVSVDEVPESSQLTKYRLIYKEGYQDPYIGGAFDLLGRKTSLGLEFTNIPVKYIDVPPSAFQPKPPSSTVGAGQSSGSGAQQAGGGPMTRSPYVNLPQWGNAPTFDMPEFLMPSFTKPDFTMPAFDAPEWQNPKFTMPAFAMPQFQMPQFDMPSFSMPSFSMPGGGSAGASASSGAAAALKTIPVADLRPHKDFIRNLQGAEAINVPVRVYLGGKVDVPAGVHADVASPVIIGGCIAAPAGGKLESNDYYLYFNTVPEGQALPFATSVGKPLPEKADENGHFTLTAGAASWRAGPVTVRTRVVRPSGLYFTPDRFERQDRKQPESEYSLAVNPVVPRLELYASKGRVAAMPSAGTVSPEQEMRLRQEGISSVFIEAWVSHPEGAPETGSVRLTTDLGSFFYSRGAREAPLRLRPSGPTWDMASMGFSSDQTGIATITAEYGEARASINIRVEASPSGETLPVRADWPPFNLGPRVYVDPHCPGLKIATPVAPVYGGAAPTAPATVGVAGPSPVPTPTSPPPVAAPALEWSEKLGDLLGREAAALEQFGEWWARSKALEPEGAKLLAEFKGSAQAYVDYVTRGISVIEQQYGSERLKTLAGKIEAWKKESIAEMDAFVASQKPRIQEIYTLTKPVLAKYGFREDMAQEESDRLLQRLSPAQQDEVREAVKPLVEFTNSLWEQFKKAHPNIISRGGALHNEAVEFVKAVGEPIVQLAETEKSKLEEAAKRLNALAERLDSYAPQMKAIAASEDALLKQLGALGSGLQTTINDLQTDMAQQKALFDTISNALRSLHEMQRDAISSINARYSSGVAMDKAVAALGQRATEADKAAFAANIGTPPLDLKLQKLLSQLEVELQKIPEGSPAELEKALAQRKKLMDTISQLLKAMQDSRMAPVLNLRANILRPASLAAVRAAQAKTLTETVSGHTKTLATAAMYLSNRPTAVASLPTLAISLASPATLLITDDRSRRAGYDPTNRKTILEIPGATYGGPESKPQLVLVPLPTGQYKVDVTGTGDGEYHLGIARLSGEKVEESLFVESIAAGQGQTYTVVVPAERPLAVQAPIEKGTSTGTAIVSNVAPQSDEGQKIIVAQSSEKEAASRTNWALWAGIAAGAIVIVVLVLMFTVKRRVVKG